MSCCNIVSPEEMNGKKTVLWIVLLLNLTMFIVEVVAGYSADSKALLADSLDMLSDALVYGLSLIVVAKSIASQHKVAKIQGSLMALLALFVLAQTIGKVFYPSLPVAETITSIGALALGANVLCLILLTRHKGNTPSMRSSWICSRNDVIGNVGVIGAGFLVGLTQSMWPDIVVSFIMSVIVLRSAYKIIFPPITKTKQDTCCDSDGHCSK